MINEENIATQESLAINNQKTAYRTEQIEYLQQFSPSTIDREDFDIDKVLEMSNEPKTNPELNVDSIEDDDYNEDEDWFGQKIKEEDDFIELSLYDHTLTKEENFADNDEKYVLIKVTKDGEFGIVDKKNIIPSPSTKCLINLSKIEDEASEFSFMPVAYSSFMGVDVLNFMKYNSDFFTCDERVFFITLLVKFKSFDFKPFYWSKEKMYQELGIKKDRASKIIQKFENLGFLSTELVKAKIEGRPMQITYFDIDGGKIIDLLSKILHDEENEDGYNYILSDIEKYLKPSVKKEKVSVTSIMQ